jgi:FK506-binding protein 2
MKNNSCNILLVFLVFLVIVFLNAPLVEVENSSPKSPPTSLQIGVKKRGRDCSVLSKDGDFLDVHYVGKLWSNGKEFDSSLKRNEPFKFQVGKQQVIQGWDKGMLGMCIGEKRKLIIPYSMAYGERGMPAGGIPEKADLVFDVELLDINNSNRKSEL